MPFKQYLTELSTHKFCVSPPGNGIDCHLFWECLYVGTIPIVEKTIAYDQFSDLSIVVIEDWDIITTDFLNKKYE